jgi:hypothetical protein
VCPEILSADQEVELLRELLRQTDMLRAKNKPLAMTEPGKLIRRPFVYPPNRNCCLQEEAMEMIKENGVG